MEIKGKVIANLGVQSGTSKAGNVWKKATIVVEYGDGQYPKRVALDNMKQADEFGKLAVGAEGTFSLDVESREFNGRWFTSVNCWKWDVGQNVLAQQTPTQQGWGQMYQQPQAQPSPVPQGDDLPF